MMTVFFSYLYFTLLIDFVSYTKLAKYNRRKNVGNVKRICIYELVNKLSHCFLYNSDVIDFTDAYHAQVIFSHVDRCISVNGTSIKTI